jgi:hypothetical protein
VAITVTPEQGRPPDLAAYALAPVIGALALLRRRWPVAVLLASAAVLDLYNLTDAPGLFSSIPLSVALVTAWAEDHRGWALAVVGWFGGSPLVFLAVSELHADFAARLLHGAVSDLALLTVLFADLVGSPRAATAAPRNGSCRCSGDCSPPSTG